MRQQVHRYYTEALNELASRSRIIENKIAYENKNAREKKLSKSIISDILNSLNVSLGSLSGFSDLNPTQLEKNFPLELERRSLLLHPKNSIAEPIIKIFIKSLKLLYAINKIIMLADLVVYAERKASFNTVLTQFKNSIIALAYLQISQLLQDHKQPFSFMYVNEVMTYTSIIIISLCNSKWEICRPPSSIDEEKQIQIQIREYITIAIILHEIADSKNKHKTSPTKITDDIKITKLLKILILLENSGFVKLKLLANHAKHLLLCHPKHNPTDIFRILYLRMNKMLSHHKAGESVELHEKKKFQVIYANAMAGLIRQIRNDIDDPHVLLFIEGLKDTIIPQAYTNVIKIFRKVKEEAQEFSAILEAQEILLKN